MDESDRSPLADFPGFASLDPRLRALLGAEVDGDLAARPELMRRVVDVLDVFVGLGLLQFAFVTAPQAAPPGATIDLVAPPAETESIAWFSVDEAGYDEVRDAVTLVGELVDVLNPPIVLETEEGPFEA